MLERAGGHLETKFPEALAAIESSIRYFDSSGVAHTADEEESVFPRLRPRLSAEELAQIEGLKVQHREADAIYAELKEVVAAIRENPGETQLHARYRALAGRFAALYRPHIEFENRELVRVARRELGAE